MAIKILMLVSLVTHVDLTERLADFLTQNQPIDFNPQRIRPLILYGLQFERVTENVVIFRDLHSQIRFGVETVRSFAPHSLASALMLGVFKTHICSLESRFLADVSQLLQIMGQNVQLARDSLPIDSGRHIDLSRLSGIIGEQVAFFRRAEILYPTLSLDSKIQTAENLHRRFQVLTELVYGQGFQVRELEGKLLNSPDRFELEKHPIFPKEIERNVTTVRSYLRSYIIKNLPILTL